MDKILNGSTTTTFTEAIPFTRHTCAQEAVFVFPTQGMKSRVFGFGTEGVKQSGLPGVLN